MYTSVSFMEIHLMVVETFQSKTQLKSITWAPWISAPDFLLIHLVDLEIFHWINEPFDLLTFDFCKLQPLGTMNFSAKVASNSSDD